MKTGRPGRAQGQVIGPVTTAGIAVFALAVGAYVGGWQLGWVELLVVAAGCLLAMLLAVPFVLGRTRLDVTRSLSDDRIEAGETIRVHLDTMNSGRRSSRRVKLEEEIGLRIETITVPALRPGGVHAGTYSITPERRSRMFVGPAVMSRSDPLGLLRRRVPQSDATEVWVYPRSRALSPLPAGFAKDLEGPTSDTSPAGDIAFHAIRPYVMGDDRRHIHWLSTAKTGSLMVRHYVDNRRPHLAVMLDPDSGSWADEQDFETAVSVAASLVASMMRRQLPVSLRVGDTTVVGERIRGTVDTALQALTLTDTSPFTIDDLTRSAVEFARSEVGASALILVTGRTSRAELAGVASRLRRSKRLLLAPVHAEAPSMAIPGAITIAAPDLDAFAAGWLRRVR